MLDLIPRKAFSEISTVRNEMDRLWNRKRSQGTTSASESRCARLPVIGLFAYHMFRAPARESGLGAFIQLFWDRAPARESGLGAFIQLRWDSSQASVAHLPHPVIAYSWDTALNLVAYPVISYLSVVPSG
jgi:hypothetical protein